MQNCCARAQKLYQSLVRRLVYKLILALFKFHISFEFALQVATRPQFAHTDAQPLVAQCLLLQGRPVSDALLGMFDCKYEGATHCFGKAAAVLLADILPQATQDLNVTPAALKFSRLAPEVFMTAPSSNVVKGQPVNIVVLCFYELVQAAWVNTVIKCTCIKLDTTIFFSHLSSSSVIFLHGLGRLTCYGIHQLPSFPRASTISSSSSRFVQGGTKKTGTFEKPNKN